MCARISLPHQTLPRVRLLMYMAWAACCGCVTRARRRSIFHHPTSNWCDVILISAAGALGVAAACSCQQATPPMHEGRSLDETLNCTLVDISKPLMSACLVVCAGETSVAAPPPARAHAHPTHSQREGVVFCAMTRTGVGAL